MTRARRDSRQAVQDRLNEQRQDQHAPNRQGDGSAGDAGRRQPGPVGRAAVGTPAGTDAQPDGRSGRTVGGDA